MPLMKAEVEGKEDSRSDHVEELVEDESCSDLDTNEGEAASVEEEEEEAQGEDGTNNSEADDGTETSVAGKQQEANAGQEGGLEAEETEGLCNGSAPSVTGEEKEAHEAKEEEYQGKENDDTGDESERLARNLQEQEDREAAAEQSMTGTQPQVKIHDAKATRVAIEKGKAILVQCGSCQKWMQVADHAKTMFCPVCKALRPVRRQTAVQTVEEAIRLNKDRQIAEELQTAEYLAEQDVTEGRSKSGRRIFRGKKAKSRSAKEASTVPSSLNNVEGQESVKKANQGDGVTPSTNAIGTCKGSRNVSEEAKCDEGDDGVDVPLVVDEIAGTEATPNESVSGKDKPDEEGGKVTTKSNKSFTNKIEGPPDTTLAPIARSTLSSEAAERESLALARQLQAEEEFAAAAAARRQSAAASTIRTQQPDGAAKPRTMSVNIRGTANSASALALLEAERSERMVREGLCPSCGRRLYEIKKTRGFSFRKATTTEMKPITIRGEVDRGRCLRCTKTDEGSAETAPRDFAHSGEAQKTKYSGGLDESGERHGQGVLRWSNGERYEGDFRNGVIEGEGKMFFADGSEYVGWWEAGKMHGHGTFRFKSGNFYSGNYSEGQRSGSGKLYFANGDMYDGHWENGKMDGPGIYSYNNSEGFEGSFREGKREGKGRYLFSDGHVEVSKYKGDVRVGEGVKWSSDRKKAWKLVDGKVKGKVSLEKAETIEEQCGN